MVTQKGGIKMETRWERLNWTEEGRVIRVKGKWKEVVGLGVFVWKMEDG